MDRRERVGDPLVSLLAAFEGMQAQLWTALPAKVVSFDATEQAAVLQVLVQISMIQPDGTEKWLTIPPLLDVPVYFPSAGGATITFPVRPGDEGAVVFSSRCIDAWWQLGPDQPQVQAEKRLHSLSDGMFFPGFKSRPKVIPAVSTVVAQFRSDSGATYVEVDPQDGFINVKTPGNVGVVAGGDIDAQAGGHIHAQAGTDITATAGGDITATASGSITASATGDVTLNGANVRLNGVLYINGSQYLAHKHTGVQPGGGTSGGVTP